MPIWFANFFLIFFLQGIIISCAPLTQDTDSPSRPIGTEVIPVEIEDNDLLLYSSLLNHPHVFDPEVVDDFLRSLYFSPVNPDFSTNKRRIFTNQAVKEIGPLFYNAFQKAKPYQKIQFRIQTSEGFTAGDTFILDEALHWRFQLIHGAQRYDDFQNIYRFDGESRVLPNWRLLPQEGQQYYVSHLVLGVKKDKTNWIVVNFSPGLGEVNTATESDTNAKQPKIGDKDLLGTLQLLRELKDEGLISEQDYQGKIRILVDEENATVPDSKEQLRFLKELRNKGDIAEEEYHNKVREILEAL